MQDRSMHWQPRASTVRGRGPSLVKYFSLAAALASLSLAPAAWAQAAPPAAAPAPVAPPKAPLADAAFARLIDAELGRAQGLTAEQAAQRAKQSSPNLRKEREEVRAAAADVSRALALYLPRLSLQAQYTRLSDVGDSGAGNIVAAPGEGPGPLPPAAQLVNIPLEFPVLNNQYSLEASLVIPLSDYFLKVAPSHKAAKLARESSERNLETATLNADTDARLAYYDWVRAKLGAIVAEQALAQTRAHLADVQALVDAGTASPADYLRVESQTARAELVAVKSRHLSELSEDRLRTMLHDDSATPYAIGEAFAAVPSAARTVPRVKELTQTAYRNRPELKAIEQAEQARRAEARAERGTYAPRLDLFGGATYANPNSRIFPQEEEWRATWEAGARLSITLNDLPVSAARAASIDAQAAALAAERSAQLDRIRGEVLAAAQAVDEAEVALGTTERGLRAAEESFRVRKLLFANGRATTVEVLDAETDLTQARYEAVGARIDRGVAQAQLARALGQVGR
jgi:outer membrane protein